MTRRVGNLPKISRVSKVRVEVRVEVTQAVRGFMENTGSIDGVIGRRLFCVQE